VPVHGKARIPNIRKCMKELYLGQYADVFE